MIPYILAAVGGYLIGDSLKGKQYAKGGMIPKEKSLLHFIQNEASSGSIANKTKYSAYKDIDAIRAKAVEILIRDGDKEYSLDSFNELIKDAVADPFIHRCNPPLTEYGMMAKGGGIKNWEDKMKGRKDIDFLRIERKEKLPNGDLMIYYKYNTLNEFDTTKVGTDVIKMADGGMMAKGGAYKIVIKKTNSPSNYNVFASLFKKGEKMPLLGTTFKDNTSKEEIKEWFEKRIKMLEKGIYADGGMTEETLADGGMMADGGVMADGGYVGSKVRTKNLRGGYNNYEIIGFNEIYKKYILKDLEKDLTTSATTKELKNQYEFIEERGKYEDGGYMEKGGVVGTYELMPFISIGDKGFVTPKYDGRVIFEGTKDNAIEKANSMLSNEILRVEVSKVNPKATSVLKRTKKIAEVFEDGGDIKGGVGESINKKMSDGGYMEKGGQVKVGDIITANTGVKVKVLEYDPKFGGRVRVERMDEHAGKPSQFMPLSRFKLEDGGYMEGGGYVAVSEKDGYWTIISKPTTKEKAQEVVKMGGLPRGEVGKVVTITQAKSHKKLIGEEYLADSGMMSGGYMQGGGIKAGDLVRLKKDKNVAQVVDDVNKDWSEWEKVNYTITGKDKKGRNIYKMSDGGYMAKGGEIYKIQRKYKYDLQPKWEDEKFHTGGHYYLSFKDAQDVKKKLQNMSSSMEYKVIKVEEK